MTYKVDLHTHSIISHDGGITENQYGKILNNGILDYVAITDHNETRYARIMQKKFGDKIIIGEEIETKDGEMIGLFLEKTVAPGQSAQETAAAIKLQGGLVYIPHPFETMRKGLQESVLKKIYEDIDIIEVFNGRARWRGKAEQAVLFAEKYNIANAASSDAHCYMGLGVTLNFIESIPNRKSLNNLLKSAVLQKQYAPLLSLLCPAINKFKNKIVLRGN